MLRALAQIGAQLVGMTWWCAVWLWYSTLARLAGLAREGRRLAAMAHRGGRRG